MKTPSPLFLVQLGLLGLTAIGCGPKAAELGRTTPEEIRGVWVTNDPDYVGRKMEIMEEALLFYSEEHLFDPFVIRSIKVEPEADGPVYEIEHSGWESGSLTLSLKFRSADSTIVFKNQPTLIWRRQAAGY